MESHISKLNLMIEEKVFRDTSPVPQQATFCVVCVYYHYTHYVWVSCWITAGGGGGWGQIAYSWKTVKVGGILTPFISEKFFLKKKTTVYYQRLWYLHQFKHDNETKFQYIWKVNNWTFFQRPKISCTPLHKIGWYHARDMGISFQNQT